jgi:thiol-disulfide isomerase/thioredoxin
VTQRGRTAAVVLGGVAVFAATGLLSFTEAFRGNGPGASASGSASDGYSTAREGFDLPSLTGSGHIRLADHRGRPVVVNFFASWCAYCNTELPGFAEVARATRGRVDFIGVQTDDPGDGPAMAQRFDLAGAGFALARDVRGEPPSGLWSAFGGQGLPVTAFYDRTGRLVEVSQGAFTRDELVAAIRQRFGVTVTATAAPTAIH